MDLQKLAQLARSNPNAAKAFLSKKQVETKPTKKVTQTSSFLKKKEPERKLQMSDRVFTERQLKMIVEALVKGEVAKIPTPKDGKTPSKEEITQLIKPLMPVIRQPKDGKDAEVTPDFVDKVANRVLKQVAVTPDLSEAILKVFSEEKVKAENIPGFTELKERVEQLARNQKYIGQGKGIASGYTDTDVLRVLATQNLGSLPDQTGNSGKFLTTDGTDASWGTPAGSGDVVGPASATNNNFAVFDGTTGKLIKDGGATIAQVRDRSTHTGTQTAATISDFQPAVAANSAVAANTAKVTNATHTGEVTGATALTIANDVVTNAKLANVATNTIKGRVTAATGDPEDLTATQVRTLINVADGATANSADATLLARANHTGTQAISTVSGLQTALDTKPTILSGAGAPATTPAKEGDVYIDTTNDTYYVAVGTASSADWEANGSAAGDVVGPASATDNAIPVFDGTTGKLIKNSGASVDASNRLVAPSFKSTDGDFSILDSLDNNLLTLVSAVGTGANRLLIENALTGNAPTLRATGTDTNISLNLIPKGTGEVQVNGEKIIDETDAASAATLNTGTDVVAYATADAIAGSYAGTKTVQITCFDYTTDVATGDGAGYIHIPASLNGMDIVSVHAEVITAGTTGTTDIQLHNVTDAVDILSTKLTIDSGETGSETAATAAVINTSNDALATNDLIRVDVDAVSTTAPQGLIVTFEARLP